MRTALWPETSEAQHRKEMEFMVSVADRYAVFVCEDRGTLIGLAEVSLREWAEGCGSSPVGYLEGWYVVADLMLTNLYMIPHVLGHPVESLDIWHSSNDAEPGYTEYLPDEVQQKITESDLAWITEQYDSSEFARIRERHIDI